MSNSGVGVLANELPFRGDTINHAHDGVARLVFCEELTTVERSPFDSTAIVGENFDDRARSAGRSAHSETSENVDQWLERSFDGRELEHVAVPVQLRTSPAPTVAPKFVSAARVRRANRETGTEGAGVSVEADLNWSRMTVSRFRKGSSRMTAIVSQR